MGVKASKIRQRNLCWMNWKQAPWAMIVVPTDILVAFAVAETMKKHGAAFRWVTLVNVGLVDVHVELMDQIPEDTKPAKVIRSTCMLRKLWLATSIMFVMSSANKINKQTVTRIIFGKYYNESWGKHIKQIQRNQ
jgi:hypothetical protein